MLPRGSVLSGTEASPGASSVPEALEADSALILSATLMIERDELAEDGRRSDAAQVGWRLRVGELLVHRPKHEERVLSEVFGIEADVMAMGTTADDAIDPRPHRVDVLLE
jgi:hypothetical protein